jgi:hypothetical protein
MRWKTLTYLRRSWIRRHLCQSIRRDQEPPS